MVTHGREVIYANYTEAQLLNGNTEEIVLDILTNSIPNGDMGKTVIALPISLVAF